VWCAFLKAVNVGSGRRVPMAELRETFEDAGLTNVRTYIQSGNVVFDSPLGDAPADELSARIEARFGFEVPVVVRSLAEMTAIERENPLLDSGEDPSRLHVMFLADLPSEEDSATLDPLRSQPDEFVVSGREVYLRFPNGAGRSKLTTDYFERRLGTTATARNWNTVLELLKMMRKPD